MTLASAAAILVAGGLIGATGIGGVLVVPALTQLEGLDVARAIAVSSLAFAFPAVAGLWWLRNGPVVGSAQLWALAAGAVPGGVLGGLLVHGVQAHWLLTALAVLAVGSGLRGLMPIHPVNPERASFGVVRMAQIGLAVGIGSALTGTGGPVILIPLLMLWRQPMALTLACAQAIQLPVALSASAVHAASGSRDLVLACGIGLVLLVGSLIGQRLARRANLRSLQILVSLLLVGTGLWFAWRVVH
jgi:uncharacterized membrane protein YfcA